MLEIILVLILCCVCAIFQFDLQVSCGLTHSAVLTDDGALYVWGKNMDGQLGTGDRRPHVCACWIFAA